MKKLIIFLALVFSLVSCNKMKCDFYFSDGGGTFNKDLEIDGETLTVRSGDESSNKVFLSYPNTADEQYSAGLDWVHAYYYTNQHNLLIFVHENTTGHERYFTVSGSLNGKETSFTFRQNK